MRSGGWLGAELLDEPRCRIADLRTFALPVRETLGFAAERFLACRRFGIVKTNTLDKAPIARASRVSNHQIKKRSLFGAAACQPDHNHVKSDPEKCGKGVILR